MSNLNRDDMKARYAMFQHFGLDDQRGYYAASINKFRRSASGVNQIRATIALLTGVASAAVGLIAALGLNEEGTIWVWVVNLLIVAATGLPAFAAFFNMLADLYQWDKLISIYDAASENIEVADALSPLDEMEDVKYLASLRAYTQGTLDVMSDETAQWGQSIRTPKGVQEFLEQVTEETIESLQDSDTTPPIDMPDDGEGLG